jgi:hypothetical protein
MSETSNQQSGYTAEVAERKPGYFIWKVTLSRGSSYFVVRPFVRLDEKYGDFLYPIEVAETLEQARSIGETLKEEARKAGHEVE